MLKGETNSLNMYRTDTDKVLFIPVFQRNYAWLVPHCRTLFEDIVRAAKEKRKHFLGDMICSLVDDGRIQVNDGQQRFVSIMLFAIAIRDIMEEMARKDTKNAKGYLNVASHAEGYIHATPLRSMGKPLQKVTVNFDDRKVMERIEARKEKAGEVDLSDIPEELRASCRLEPNYRFFVGELKKFIKDGGDVISLLEAVDRIEINMMYCSESEAQEIYASKNTKGLALSSPENIKNFLLAQMPAKEQENAYMDCWLEMERLVHRQRLDDFTTDVMVLLNEITPVRTMKWTPRNLYGNLVKYFAAVCGNKKESKSACAGNILKAFEKYAELFHKYLLFPAVFNVAKATPLQRRLYEFENVFGGSKGNCLVLYLLSLYEENRITEAVLTECMTALSVAQVRGKFVGQFKGQQRGVAAKNLKLLVAETKDRRKCPKLGEFLWRLLLDTKGTQGIPSDETTVSYFTENQLGSGFGISASHYKVATRYLFYRMNEVAGKGAKLPPFSVDNCNVEHIIPPKNRAVWKKDLNTDNARLVERYVQRMGNLVLVARNSDDDGFAKKAAAYRNSKYPLTKAVGQKSAWTLDDVKKNTEKLAELFVKAFPIPAKYVEK